MSLALSVCAVEELPPGQRRVVEDHGLEVLVLNCNGRLLAVENRCSHEDTPLADGEVDASGDWIECPRHGSRFDLRTGRPLNLPAYLPIEVFPVEVDGDLVTVALG